MGTTTRTMRRDRRAHVALAAVGVLLLGGCSLLPSDDDPPTTSPAPATGPATPKDGIVLPEGTKEVAVPLDEAVQIALPDGSPGVGDLWGVASIDDPAIVEADVVIGEDVMGAEDTDNEDGSTQPYAIELHGLTDGETTVRVLYCTRVHEVSEDCDQSQGTLDPPVEPVEIAVRVG